MAATRTISILAVLALFGCLAPDPGAGTPTAPASTVVSPQRSTDLAGLIEHQAANPSGSVAYRWVDFMLEVTGNEVDKIGARPTIISRQMAIPMTAMFDAWAAYDDRAVGTRLGGSLRRPAAERTQANKEKALSYAVYRTLVDLFPDARPHLSSHMRALGYDPEDDSSDLTTPQGIGNAAARAVLDYRKHDGANQHGDHEGSAGEPYSDYTKYVPVNLVDRVVDPDRWQPIPFSDGKGGTFAPGFLTPHWYKVKPFALARADQFRPGPPPLVGSPELAREVAENIEMNAHLSLDEKALVEFMRDGPRSTGQSGHWLRFAQDLSRRDRYDLDQDVKLFFAIANTAFDAFIAAWDAKRVYDSSRPWTLVRHYHKGKKIEGFLGPCKGVGTIAAEAWQPYSPPTFVTPPFPGYVSGHSTVSAASAKMLELVSGSDRLGVYKRHRAGQYTEAACEAGVMQARGGVADPTLKSAETILKMPTFSGTAEMAGRSRILGGYHIQSDNIAGLELGRAVAEYSWPIYQSYFAGTAASQPTSSLQEKKRP